MSRWKRKPNVSAQSKVLTCKATASGGALRCALEAGHAGAHATAPRGAKPTQHASWTTNAAGQVVVTTLARGKKQGEWIEDAPIETTTEGGTAGTLTISRPGEQPVEAEQHREAVRRRTSEIMSESCDACGGIGMHSTECSQKLPNIFCNGRSWPVHPAALIFPTPEPQYREIVESIRAEGQKHPIQLIDTPLTPVIDGCSRLRACAELGIEPRTEVIKVDDPIKHVIAVNLARRHLDESQRAMAAADLANIEHGTNQHTKTGGSAGPPPISQAQAAQLTGASERLTRAAARVKNLGVPEVAQAVRDRRIKVDAAVELAKLDAPKQREILEKVTQGKSEVRPGKVRALVRQEQKRELVRQINTGRVAPMPAGEFGVILVDYPWHYDNSDQHEGSRGHIGYPPMTMDEVLTHAHEAAKRAAKDCVIALWVTNAYMFEVGRVIGAYGATHRTMLTWPKPRMGIGSWGRGQTEHLVIASIGEPAHTLNEISTLLPAYALREHSRKPDEVAELLAKHCGGPFLELFAREPREGWSTWGAEADGAKALEQPKPKRSKILTDTDRRLRAS